MSQEVGTSILKDPNADLPYAIDWTEWLGEADIDESTWTISGTGLEQDDDEIVSAGKVTQVWLSGGTVGTKYTVTNRITTDETPPRVDDRSFYVQIRNR